MAGIIGWPTAEPGRPYRWLRSLAADAPAASCPLHRIPTGTRGVCPACVAAYREAWTRRTGASIDARTWTVCTGCGLPVHPAAERLADGSAARTCPSCGTGAEEEA